MDECLMEATKQTILQFGVSMTVGRNQYAFLLIPFTCLSTCPLPPYIYSPQN